MSAPRGVDGLLDVAPSLVLVGGKGGVGKTTCASALALAAARRGERTLLLSTDPARALPDALGTPVGGEPAEVPGRPGLFAAQLDAASERDRFLDRWRETIALIVDRGTYLDREDIDGLVDAALPGADETFAVLALADLAADPGWARIVVDTAPTGHTLRLLSLPETFADLLRLLDTMQGKHRFMVHALTHRYRADEADAFLDDMRGRVDGLRRTLGVGRTEGGARRSAAVLVARPEALVVAESARYVEALAGLGVRVAAVVVNAVPENAAGEVDPSAREATETLAGVASGAAVFLVPRLAEAPMGVQAVERWGAGMRRVGSAGSPRRASQGLRTSTRAERSSGAGPSPERSRPGLRRDGDGDSPGSTQVESGGGAPDPGAAAADGHPPIDPATLAPSLTIVGGKGGVGKTTVACALAIALASPDAPLLLVSTDPAPSVGDALALEVGDAETEVPGVPGLSARQMDAAAAFERLRDTYRSRVDRVFDDLMGGALDAAHDRAVLRDLLRLAPPGIDELYALSLLGDTLAERRFTRVIVDPAPTGHLLRLLEMPALALDWSHRLMRLMLKYKEAAPLGDAAGEVLAFAKRTRAVGELLGDPLQSALLLVALDEPLVRAETVRLARAVAALGVRVHAVVWNRVAEGTRPLEPGAPEGHLPDRIRGVVAPAADPPPRGAEALRAWMTRWRELPSPEAHA